MKICFIAILIFVNLFLFSEGARRRRGIDHETKQVVCYDELGCFSKSPPFSPSMPLPMSPSKIQTEYYLRTRHNLLVDQPIIPDAANLTDSHFDPDKPTKVLIHGFVMINSGLAKWVPEVTEAILFQEDVNVIQINWVKGANVEYDNAVSNTRIVGAQVAYLINLLMEVRGATAQDFHLIGFSLGAHVAGFAGKNVQTGGKKKVVGRITGLDPASPGFNYDDPKVRLDKSDAKFVDVIHTDTKTILVMASGMNRNLGHIDFYPNGGADQTGCNSWTKDSSWMSAVTDTTVCDHLRAPQLFKASINATDDEPHMTGYKCENFDKFKRGVCLRCRGPNGCNRMGYWAKPLTSNKKQVQYYLLTSGEAPFTVKHYQVQIHWRNHSEASSFGFKARLFLTLHGDKGSTSEIALNDGSTFHVFAGRTTRFLITRDITEDIGQILRIEFRWERPSCYSWFFCGNENINLKRIKVYDASEQRRSVYLPLGKSRSERIRSHFIKPNEKFELLRSSYIRTLYPNKYTSLDREESLRNMIHPNIVRAHPKKSLSLRQNTENNVSTTTLSAKPTTT